MNATILKKLMIGLAALLLCLCALLVWKAMRTSGPGAGFVSGNGRIEATDINVATKTGGRILEVFVNEGDRVSVGQPLVQMQQDVLLAQRDEARAHHQQAIHAETSAAAQVAVRRSDLAAAQALVVQRESELDAAKRRLARTRTLSAEGAASLQEFDDDSARMRSLQAALGAAQAQVAAAQAAITAAQAQVVGAASMVTAGLATVARIDADIADTRLKSPRSGRIQFRIGQPGEVLAPGGKVLNLVDLADVYMTFFLPEVAAGKVQLGTEVRIILDTEPDVVIPAAVTYVSNTAQFTPKSVETASERQKLMFRVKAQIDPATIEKMLNGIKTGLPGVAWVRIDPKIEWPASLAVQGQP